MKLSEDKPYIKVVYHDYFIWNYVDPTNYVWSSYSLFFNFLKLSKQLDVEMTKTKVKILNRCKTLLLIILSFEIIYGPKIQFESYILKFKIFK
jgi:hypothetical protein